MKRIFALTLFSLLLLKEVNAYEVDEPFRPFAISTTVDLVVSFYNPGAGASLALLTTGYVSVVNRKMQVQQLVNNDIQDFRRTGNLNASLALVAQGMIDANPELTTTEAIDLVEEAFN